MVGQFQGITKFGRLWIKMKLISGMFILILVGISFPAFAEEYYYIPDYRLDSPLFLCYGV